MTETDEEPYDMSLVVSTPPLRYTSVTLYVASTPALLSHLPILRFFLFFFPFFLVSFFSSIDESLLILFFILVFSFFFGFPAFFSLSLSLCTLFPASPPLVFSLSLACAVMEWVSRVPS